MEFSRVVLDRRAVRRYQARAVPREIIEDLVGLAIHAPSSMNQQPWAFAIIDDAARVEECSQLAREYFLAHEEAPNTVRALLGEPNQSIFHHAPVLVLVLSRLDTEQAREDCCLAAQTFMLAARDAGLGTCWVGFGRPWLNRPETRTQLKLPQGCRVVAPIVLGYPVEWPPEHGRVPAEIHWVR